MQKVEKEEPKFFTTQKASIQNQRESTAWSKTSKIRNELREHILSIEQKNMCIYCEKKITSCPKKSNIDHFKTRHHFPNLTLDYNNLFISCNNTHCSNSKDNLGLKKEEFNNLLNPLVDDIENSFEYSETGKIIPLNEKAIFTKDCFDLDNPSLVKARIEIARNIEAYKDFDVDTLSECLGGHINFIKYLKSNS